MNILKAGPEEAQQLTELTMRSKAYWGYDPSQMEEWRDELSITQEYIERNEAYKLVVDDRTHGFYAFKKESPKLIKLDFLFIEPKSIGKGYGSLLLEDFIGRMRSREDLTLILEADPNAQKFYFDRGFRIKGFKQSSIPGRVLPVMELVLRGL